jgi:hypothetical protein
MYIYICYNHASYTQRNHPASHPSLRSTHHRNQPTVSPQSTHRHNQPIATINPSPQSTHYIATLNPSPQSTHHLDQPITAIIALGIRNKGKLANKTRRDEQDIDKENGDEDAGGEDDSE